MLVSTVIWLVFIAFHTKISYLNPRRDVINGRVKNNLASSNLQQNSKTKVPIWVTNINKIYFCS